MRRGVGIPACDATIVGSGALSKSSGGHARARALAPCIGHGHDVACSGRRGHSFGRAEAGSQAEGRGARAARSRGRAGIRGLRGAVARCSGALWLGLLLALGLCPVSESASYAGAYRWTGTTTSPPDVNMQKGCESMLLSETYQTIELGATDLEMRAGYSAPSKYGPGLIDEEPLALAYSSFVGHMTGQNIFEGSFHGQGKCTGQFLNSRTYLHCWLHPMASSHCLITLECYAGPCYDPTRYPQYDNDYDSNGVRRKHPALEGQGVGAPGPEVGAAGVRRGRKTPSLMGRVGRFWRYKMGGWRGTLVVVLLLVAGSLVGYSFRELQKVRTVRDMHRGGMDGYWSVASKDAPFRPSAMDELPFDTV